MVGGLGVEGEGSSGGRKGSNNELYHMPES